MSLDPASDEYGKELGNGLKLRWARMPQDQYGVMFVGSLAYGVDEGQQSDYVMRRSEYGTSQQHHEGRAYRWAVCVDTSTSLPPLATWTPAKQNSFAEESDYFTQNRQLAGEAKERIVAVVGQIEQRLHFDGQSEGVAFGRPTICACLDAYRGRRVIMQGLFEMQHAASRAAGQSFSAVTGVPGYYRQHGYEYGFRVLTERLTSFKNTPPVSDNADYSLRPAQPEDAEALAQLQEAPRGYSQLWTTDSRALEAASWNCGVRSPPFDRLEKGFDDPMIEPASLLEYKGKLVAAVVFMSGNVEHRMVARRILWSPSHSDLAELARELVTRLVSAVDGLYDMLEAQMGLMLRPTEVHWMLSAGHLIGEQLGAQRLARLFDEDGELYSPYHYLAVRIHSLPLLLRQLIPTLNARLEAAENLLGASLTSDLGIAFYRIAVPGAILRIVDSRVKEVAERIWKRDELEPDEMKLEKGVHLVGPGAALVQLFFGFASFTKLREAHVDLQVTKERRLLVDALFPPRVYDGHAYF